MRKLSISTFLLENYDLIHIPLNYFHEQLFQINLMFIMAMGRIYEKLAVKLTDWGNI